MLKWPKEPMAVALCMRSSPNPSFSQQMLLGCLLFAQVLSGEASHHRWQSRGWTRGIVHSLKTLSFWVNGDLSPTHPKRQWADQKESGMQSKADLGAICRWSLSAKSSLGHVNWIVLSFSFLICKMGHSFCTVVSWESLRCPVHRYVW
jgi:hypothetical protein